ncbi:MAG: DUF6519 domain-containing protein [Methanosarcinales archaeon]|nr:DUF6519 domain-containing protein [Methanosarcinales archaeon]
MKGDYSRIPFNERKKMQHYRKVYLQQGKVLLDSDLNENTDLLHYQMKTLVKDGLCGSPNIGFRIGRGVPLMPVDDHRYIGEEKGWSVNNGTLTVNYFEKFEGKGSLKLENAAEVSFAFQKPVDLSKYRYLRLALKPIAANAHLTLVRFDGTKIGLKKQEQTTDQNEFSVIKYVFPLDAVLDNITKVILTGIDSNTIYHIGVVECSPPMFTLEPMTQLKGWSFEPGGSAEISIDGEVIKASQVTKLYKKHFSTIDFSKFETIEFAINSSSTSTIQFYVIDANDNTSYWEINIFAGELKKYSIEIPQKGNDSDTPADLASIKEYGFRVLSDEYTYHFGSILYGMSLTNNFLISGADPLSGETGRLYVDGELYEKDEAETYLNQKDHSSAPSIETVNENRKDLVYVDVWQRHVTSAEDPELREVAVGVDTCNRMKAVAQVKVLKDSTSLPPDLRPTGECRLSTAVEYIETEKLCEITPGVEYTGLENRLYRVEIHAPETYKWSRNNASTVSQIIENVNEGAASVKVKEVKLFEIGDIIEITDDRVEFADRQKESDSSIKPWGELRRITSIDRNKNELVWDTTAPDDPLSASSTSFGTGTGTAGPIIKMTGGLPHDYTAEGVETIHPRVIKWDGANITSNEETLEDGIKIRFSESDMLPSDYWTFTARENTRTVEKLDNEPPQGVVHRYYPLATIEWDENGEIINVTDLRTRFEPLCGITAADLAFDNANTPIWTDAENVQQALERITFPKAEGIEFSNKCMDLYGTGINVQDALDNLCNGITVPSLTLKGKDGEQSKWPKLECSKNRDLVGIENGLQIGMSPTYYNNFYMVSDFINNIRGFRLYKGNGPHLLTVSANGNVGIGTPEPKNKLDVEGGAVIGNKYSGSKTAPVSGLLVHGKVGIGTDNTTFGRLTIQDSAVSLAFRETGMAVNQGGLWRIPLYNGTLRFDVNTGAQGSEFGKNYITPLKMTKEGEVIVAGELEAPFFKAGQGNSNHVTRGKWYRIAKNKTSDKRANAEFTLRDYKKSSQGSSTLTFRIGISHNDHEGMSFTVLNHSRYLETTFTKIRVLEKKASDTQYLEVFANFSGLVDYSIYDNLQDGGWEPVNWMEVSEIPEGYNAREFDVDNLFVVGDYKNRFIVERGGNVGIGTDEPKSSLHIKKSDKVKFPLVTENPYPIEITPDVICNFFESMSTNSVILGVPEGGELEFFWKATVNRKTTIFHGKLTGQEFD